MRRFNVTGVCTPEEDYMVDISRKIEQIKQLVDRRCYFTINRARQYGKTTALNELRKALADEYTVISLSFQGIGDESFASSKSFCQTFIRQIVRALRFSAASKEYIEKWSNGEISEFDELSHHITAMCEDKKLVLLIDEVDRTSNNRIFLHFIDMLRDKFLSRKTGQDYTFHSVILAGVYDIKNIKLKLIDEGLYAPSASENKIYNSPWNIAVNFNIDMSFSSSEVSTMLDDYEKDHGTGMDIPAISDEIYNYTSGYPFLVSRICQCIDEELNKEWTINGIREAVKIMLIEKNTLFDDLFKNLENNKDLYSVIYDILIAGNKIPFNADNPTLDLGMMYGIIKESERHINISNKIFEIRICDYLISKDNQERTSRVGVLQRDVIKDGRFDMELCLRKFADHYAEIFTEDDMGFLESHGRLIFLSYLRPLINGQGFYHIESQLTDLRRMDIVADFGREQFIIELKIWKGEKAEEKAYEQLLGYMETKKANKGYLLTFDFRLKKNKERKSEWLDIDGKKIFEVII
ncbi:MAG: AAA-like domain-containing protein [Oscillospiraceae bacterium]|nr:AAA-like domain-containing protein [Oscillospiraceae bacterium]